MLERLLRTTSIAVSLVIGVSWGMFAADEARSASNASQTEIAGRQAAREPDPRPAQERLREQAHSGARELVDDADDVVLSPFASVAQGSTSRWVRRTVPAALALLVFGLGLAVLARFAAGR